MIPTAIKSKKVPPAKGSTAKLPSHRGQAADKYQKIIDAATLVFAEKGFHTAKISDIAKVAQIADGTIYLYFKNKDDLLISVFEYSIDLFIHTVEDALKTVDTPVEKLRCFIDIYLQLIKRYPALAQVTQLELRQSSKFMKEYTNARFFDFLAILGTILEDGQKSGSFRNDVSAQRVRRALFGALDEIALEWLLMKHKKYSLEDAAHDLNAIFIEGLLITKSTQTTAKISTQKSAFAHALTSPLQEHTL